jgi:hypothetical protein
MAINILSMPAMSAYLERLFSGGKAMITDCRNRLPPESIEAIEYMKNWFNLRAWHEENEDSEVDD